MYTHSVSDFAPVVAAYVLKHGIGEWADLFRHVEAELQLTAHDLAGLNSDGHPRWQRKMLNLRSNEVLIGYSADIIQIQGGFATIAYAEAHCIPEDIGDRTKTTRGSSGIRFKKPDNRKGEKNVRHVYKEYIPMLAKLYDPIQLLADIRNPRGTVDEFGIKYKINELTLEAA